MSAVGDRLDERYRLIELIGRGGMSDVYRAIDERDDSPVAIKVVRSGDAEFVRRLTLEVRAMEGFEHPGLIRLLDAGGDGAESYLVMEYVDGETLGEVLRRGALAPAEVAPLGASLAGSLAYVHERGVVHRDVKPSNILRSREGDVWLGDFGIAQLLDATSHTMTGTAMGTVTYMSPEQLTGKAVGARADVWSLGLVLLECLTGERPFVGTPSEIMARRLGGPVAPPSDLPGAWRMLLAVMLEEDPARRVDAGEVANLLATSPFAEPWVRAVADADATTVVTTAGAERTTRVLLAGGAAATARGFDETSVVATRPAPRATPAPGARRRRRRLVVIALVGALALALLAWAWAASSSSPPTTTTTSTTTTTTITSGQVLTRLLTELASAQRSGQLSPALTQAIAQYANQAVSSSIAGDATGAQSDLQDAASLVASQLVGGQLSATTANQLQGTIAQLARTLGLAVPSTTVPTTTFPTPGPPPGHGHNKNGH